ncbi:MAG: hypothetical protein MN733_22015, partial [Nitrososphaera sp.]|nr:hypothetical protein [Nitrososphaera sp.]
MESAGLAKRTNYSVVLGAVMAASWLAVYLGSDVLSQVADLYPSNIVGNPHLQPVHTYLLYGSDTGSRNLQHALLPSGIIPLLAYRWQDHAGWVITIV